MARRLDPGTHPGVHEPEEAPWWEFTCSEDLLPVVKQWMGEAADVFALQLAALSAGGEVVYLRCDLMSGDGLSGYYTARFSEHRSPTRFVVYRRGHPMEKPDAELQAQ